MKVFFEAVSRTIICNSFIPTNLNHENKSGGLTWLVMNIYSPENFQRYRTQVHRLAYYYIVIPAVYHLWLKFLMVSRYTLTSHCPSISSTPLKCPSTKPWWKQLPYVHLPFMVLSTCSDYLSVCHSSCARPALPRLLFSYSIITSENCSCEKSTMLASLTDNVIPSPTAPKHCRYLSSRKSELFSETNYIETSYDWCLHKDHLNRVLTVSVIKVYNKCVGFVCSLKD